MKKFIKWSKDNRECKFSIDINGNELNLEILSGKLQLMRLIKYVVKHTDIPKIQYKRISPYRILKRNFKKGLNGKQTFQSDFIINFMKINNNLQIKEEAEKVIVITYDCGMYLKDSCKIFIPDLMELIVYKGYAEKKGNGYKIIKDLSKPMFNQYEEYYPSNTIEFENGSIIKLLPIDNNTIRSEGIYIDANMAKELDKEYNKTKFVKSNNNNKNKQKYKLTKQDKKELLRVQINYTLDSYPLNKEEFIKLSNEYNKL